MRRYLAGVLIALVLGAAAPAATAGTGGKNISLFLPVINHEVRVWCPAGWVSAEMLGYDFNFLKMGIASIHKQESGAVRPAIGVGMSIGDTTSEARTTGSSFTARWKSYCNRLAREAGQKPKYEPVKRTFQAGGRSYSAQGVRAKFDTAQGAYESEFFAFAGKQKIQGRGGSFYPVYVICAFAEPGELERKGSAANKAISSIAFRPI